jgi:hypothetical protein
VNSADGDSVIHRSSTNGAIEISGSTVNGNKTIRMSTANMRTVTAVAITTVGIVQFDAIEQVAGLKYEKLRKYYIHLCTFQRTSFIVMIFFV